MAARSNAITEITRFWLQSRHGCLVDESVPVKVPYGNSDIDLVAIRPDLSACRLPTGAQVVRLIVETKDEHDFDAKGKDIGNRLRNDLLLLRETTYIPAGTKCAFSMLRQEHYEKAATLFGTTDFVRLFVVHNLDPVVRNEVEPFLAAHRIHWLTIREVVSDLMNWYQAHRSPAGLRHTLVGDLWHLLVGYCGLELTGN